MSLFLTCAQHIQSNPVKPYWVNGMQKDALIVSGMGRSVERAKQNAMVNLRSEIVEAISVKIKTRSRSHSHEYIYGNSTTYYEEFSRYSETSSAYNKALTGVSQANAKDYYWEKNGDNFVYHIIYPFSSQTMKKYIEGFEAFLNNRVNLLITPPLQMEVKKTIWGHLTSGDKNSSFYLSFDIPIISEFNGTCTIDRVSFAGQYDVNKNYWGTSQQTISGVVSELNFQIHSKGVYSLTFDSDSFDS